MSANRTNKIGTKHQWEAFRPKACKVQYGNIVKAYFDSRQNMSPFCNLLCTIPLFTTNLVYKLCYSTKLSYEWHCLISCNILR